MAAFDKFSPEQVVIFLKDNIPTISKDILKRIVDHKIDGDVLLALDDSTMREIAPLLGDRVKIKKVLNVALSRTKVSTTIVSLSS